VQPDARPTTGSPPVVRETPEQLVERAAALARSGTRRLLGITGAPGAGKSTLCDALLGALGGSAALVGMDGFHYANRELRRLGRRDRKGAPDTFDALGYAALLRRLREDEDEVIYAPGFERDLEQPIAGAIPVFRESRLIVSEGNYLLVDDPRWSRVRPLADEIWYVDLSPEERLRRLVDRHVRYGKDETAAIAWATGTDEQNAEIIMATRDRADLVIPAALMRSVGRPPAAPR
jgi:pantothenate kinase